MHEYAVRFTEAELVANLSVLAQGSDDESLLYEFCELLLVRSGQFRHRSSNDLGAEVQQILRQVYGYEVEAN